MANIVDIDWSTNIDPSGYSSCARSYIKALMSNDRCDVGVIINNVAKNINAQGIDIKDLLKLSKISVSKKRIGSKLVQHCVPDRMVFGFDHNILYTVVEMCCPDRWVEICNKCDLIMTASNYCKEMMSNSGIDRNRVEVVPHCHDTFVWNPEVKPLNIKNLKEYNFLFLGDYTPRKNGDLLVRSYIKAFEGNKDVTLTIKAYFNSFSEIDQCRLRDRLKQVSESCGVPFNKIPTILFYGNSILETHMPRFMNSFDCLVSPHRSEGWGLSMSQMMCLGKPVISTGFSGNLEFMNDENSYLVEIDGFERVCPEMVSIFPYAHDQFWPIINENDLIDKMKHVYLNREESLKKGKIASADMMKKYNFSTISNRILDLLE